MHAVDCDEAPAGTPVLPLERALDAAEQPSAQLCLLCGAAELDPVIQGFDRGFEETWHSGWILQKLGSGRGPSQGVIHAVDCGEAPAGVPPLTLDQALDAAEHPGVRLCSLCGAALTTGWTLVAAVVVGAVLLVWRDPWWLDAAHLKATGALRFSLVPVSSRSM